MKKYFYLSLLIFPILLTAIFLHPFRDVLAAETPPKIPDGFNLILADLGTRLYKKDYAEGNPDFVQIIDLSKGADIELLHGKIAKQDKGKGVYGGDNPEFESMDLITYWNKFSQSNPDAFCVTNGQFFYIQTYPYKLAYPMKIDGKYITDGFENRFYPEEKLLLEIWEHRADIRKATKTEFYSSSAPNILGGLTEHANRKGKFQVGRTFVGVGDYNQDGLYESVLIFNTLSARQSEAADMLRQFGAAKVMMLDGGGSTQLYCRDNWYVKSDRLIPQAIGIASAQGEEFAADIKSYPSFLITSVNEPLPFKIDIENIGHNKWTKDLNKASFSIPKVKYTITEPFIKDVEPNDIITYTWEIPAFPEWGKFNATVSILEDVQPIPNGQKMLSIYVLPEDLRLYKQDLLNELETIDPADTTLLSEKFLEWVNIKLNLINEKKTPRAIDNSTVSPTKFNFLNVLWIPIIMLPLAIILIMVLDIRKVH